MLFETERLYLRKFKKEDIDVFYTYRNDIRCKKYQRWQDTSREYLLRFIELHQTYRTLDNGGIQLPIILKETDEMIGDIYIARKDKTFTIGYTLAPKYWHHGYMREMAGAVVRKILEDYPDDEVVGMVDPDNTASCRVLESIGFIKEHYIEKVNSLIYVMKNQ